MNTLSIVTSDTLTYDAEMSLRCLAPFEKLAALAVAVFAAIRQAGAGFGAVASRTVRA